MKKNRYIATIGKQEINTCDIHKVENALLQHMKMWEPITGIEIIRLDPNTNEQTILHPDFVRMSQPLPDNRISQFEVHTRIGFFNYLHGFICICL